MKMKRTQALLVSFLLVLALTMVGIVAAQEATPEATAEPGRAFLGIVIGEADNGVLVTEVTPDGPSDVAGIQANDIITTFAGEPVTIESLLTALEGQVPGDVVDLEIERGDETLTVSVTLGERPADLDNDRRGRGGNRFDFMNSDDEITFLSEEGVIEIITLGEDSPLAEAGLQAGDRITAINGEAIEGGQFRFMMPDMRGDAVITLTIDRSGEAQDFEVPAEVALQLFGAGLRGMIPGMGEMMVPPMQGFGPNGNNNGGNNRGFRDFNGRGRLGVAFVNLDETTAAEYNVDVTEGALITQVEPGSPAETAGLQENDIVTAVNGEVVDAEHTLADRIYAYEPDDVVTLDVLRAGESQQIEVTLGQGEQRSGLMPMMPGMGGMNGMPGMQGLPGMGGNMRPGAPGQQPNQPVPQIPNQGTSL
ncbi:MAG: PDZ domain-containing protein [Chitinophagaceae bacterium]|nr:PDZ domain-containing protein [Anaerolineae bacterium]